MVAGVDRISVSLSDGRVSEGEVVGQDVTYAGIDGVDVVGYLAKPASGEATAGVLVIHEWWGLNDNIRSMARQLAGEGYLALQSIERSKGLSVGQGE